MNLERWSKIWVVEWSDRQQQFNVNTLDCSLRSNSRAFIEERRMDYIPIAVAHSMDEAHELLEELKALRDSTKGM
jgi:hypothetical protein